MADIFNFFFQGNKFIFVADGIPQKLYKCIYHLNGFFFIPLPDQPLDTCQSIINIVRIDLHLQGMDFCLTFGFFHLHQFLNIIIQFSQHVIISSGKLPDLLSSLHLYQFIQSSVLHLPHILYQLGERLGLLPYQYKNNQNSCSCNSNCYFYNISEIIYTFKGLIRVNYSHCFIIRIMKILHQINGSLPIFLSGDHRTFFILHLLKCVPDLFYFTG